MRLLHSEAGQGLVEYALILALVAITLVAALQLIGADIASSIMDSAQKIADTIR